MVQGKTIRVAVGVAGLLLLAGCRQDMHDQPKFYPQRSTSFYADGRSARPQVENTVARNQLHTDTYLYTGLVNGKEGDGMPLPVNMALLQRGQEQYNIYCTPCHSRVGNGEGMIVQRGYRPAGNFHTDRLRAAPLGHFFSVITNGYGAMPEYASQISTANRWAIVAYIRALQLSQNATAADVPSNAHPQDLHELAAQEGMPPGDADEWMLPKTAVYGTPDPSAGIPGQSINTPPNGAGAHGSGAATQNSGIRNSPGAPARGLDSQAPGSLDGRQR